MENLVIVMTIFKILKTSLKFETNFFFFVSYRKVLSFGTIRYIESIYYSFLKVIRFKKKKKIFPQKKKKKIHAHTHARSSTSLTHIRSLASPLFLCTGACVCACVRKYVRAYARTHVARSNCNYKTKEKDPTEDK